MRVFKYVGLLLTLISFNISSFAQSSPPVITDTLHITLDSAQNMFTRNNLLLLAQRYNIDVQKAFIQQARLYNNPNLAFAKGFYNNVSKKYFAKGYGDEGGETSTQVSQLIILAGKRNKQIKIAQANTRLSEEQFFDLLRTLKYALRTAFFNIYYLKESARVYNEEIGGLNNVVKAFNEQRDKNYISEKEIVRVKAQLYSLLNEYNDLVNRINDNQSQLRLILQTKPNTYLVPTIDTSKLALLDPVKYPYASLLDSAYQNRTDLRIARVATDISKLNYNYQKALAIPDVTLSFGYDKQGSYIKDFNSLGFSIDVPIFNRNQGNIKAARSNIKVNETTQKSVEATVEENIYRALQKAIDADKLYKNIEPPFSGDFDRLSREVLSNYQKRNLGLLDFLDFYDAYKQNVLQLNYILYNRLQTLEDINFYTGTNFFN